MTATLPATAATAGPRDRECYFLAAYQILAERGSAGITVNALCERIGVTKGSFYHHFTDLPEFVAAFADRWRAWVERILDDYMAETDALKRVELAGNSHWALMTRAEQAIWAWGHSEPVIATAQRAVMARGAEVCLATYVPFTGDERIAADLTRMMLSGLLGMLQRPAPVDPDRLVRILAEWGRRCLHLEIEVTRVGGRAVMRVLGRSDDPVPPHRPLALPPTNPDGTRPFFDAAVAAAVAQLTPTAFRGREAFFRVAREILAEQGSDGVTVGAMCERLGVTKGSFHHHFATMPVFVAALAEHWEQRWGALIDNYASEPDPLHRFSLAFATSLAVRHPTEVAWWVWGRTEPMIADVLERQAEHAEATLAQMIAELLGDGEAADLMAEFGVGIALGLHLWRPPVGPDTFAVVVIEWVRRCLHLEADLVTLDGITRVVLDRAQESVGAGSR